MNEKIKNYTRFKDIKKLFNPFNQSIIPAEWCIFNEQKTIIIEPPRDLSTDADKNFHSDLNEFIWHHQIALGERLGLSILDTLQDIEIHKVFYSKDYVLCLIQFQYFKNADEPPIEFAKFRSDGISKEGWSELVESQGLRPFKYEVIFPAFKKKNKKKLSNKNRF